MQEIPSAEPYPRCIMWLCTTMRSLRSRNDIMNRGLSEQWTDGQMGYL